MLSARLSKAVQSLPFSFLTHARDTGAPPNREISLRSLLIAAGSKTRIIRVAILRYEWRKPDPNAWAQFPKWDDWAFEEIFERSNGWSMSDYWSRATLGLIRLSFDLYPWRTLPLDNSGQMDDKIRSNPIGILKKQATSDGVQLGGYDQVVAFISPPPSNSGAAGNPADALFDQNAALFFYEHEMGHVIGFQHAWGPKNGGYAHYEDNYCVMGWSKDQSHALVAPDIFKNTVLAWDFWTSDRRLSVASLYRHVPSFASSSSVIRLVNIQAVNLTLRGLCWGQLLDPVLAVIATKQGEITVEYRPNVGDDAGVDPAVVIHSIGRRNVKPGASEVKPIFYEGKIPTKGGGSFTTKEGDIVVTLGNVMADGKSVTVQINQRP